MYCIEMINEKLFSEKEIFSTDNNKDYYDPFGRAVKVNSEYFDNNEGDTVSPEYYNNTKYIDNPFGTLENKHSSLSSSTRKAIFRYTAAFAATVLLALSIIVYKGTSASVLPFAFMNSAIVNENIAKPVEITKIEESKVPALKMLNHLRMFHLRIKRVLSMINLP